MRRRPALRRRRAGRRDGEEIGDVENIVFNGKGEVLSLIVEVGGL
ncbi:PRC-barrel domain-containing protein [Sinorhizobium arboris]